MIPKWAKQSVPSIAPKFDELISILQSAQTFSSTGNVTNVKRLSNNNDYDDDEKKSAPVSASVSASTSMMQLDADQN